MRYLISLLILCSSPFAFAQKASPLRCQKDADCRFAYINWCQRQCPPCGRPWRKAENRQSYTLREELWAKKRVRCAKCRRKCKPRWRGDKAICRKARCVVLEKGPVELTSFVDANIGGQVYKLKVRWNFSMGRFTPANRIQPPPHYAAAMEFSGIVRSSYGPQQRLAEVELVLTEKEVLRPPEKKGLGRLLYHAEVTKLRWLGAPRGKGALP